MTQSVAGIGTIVGSAIKFRLYVFVPPEFLVARAQWRTEEVARQKFSPRLLNIVVKKQSALSVRAPSLRGECNLRCYSPAAKQSYFSAATPRPRASAATTGIKRNVINVPFCGLTRARDRREK